MLWNNKTACGIEPFAFDSKLKPRTDIAKAAVKAGVDQAALATVDEAVRGVDPIFRTDVGEEFLVMPNALKSNVRIDTGSPVPKADQQVSAHIGIDFRRPTAARNELVQGACIDLEALEAQACQGEAGVKRLFGVVSVCGIDAHQGEARGVDRWATDGTADAPFTFFQRAHHAGGVTAAEGEGTANAGYKP